MTHRIIRALPVAWLAAAALILASSGAASARPLNYSPGGSGSWSASNNGTFGLVWVGYYSANDYFDSATYTNRVGLNFINVDDSGYGELQRDADHGQCATWNQTRSLIDQVSCQGLDSQKWRFNANGDGSGTWENYYNVKCVRAAATGNQLTMPSASACQGPDFNFKWTSN